MYCTTPTRYTVDEEAEGYVQKSCLFQPCRNKCLCMNVKQDCSKRTGQFVSPPRILKRCPSDFHSGRKVHLGYPTGRIFLYNGGWAATACRKEQLMLHPDGSILSGGTVHGLLYSRVKWIEDTYFHCDYSVQTENVIGSKRAGSNNSTSIW